MRAPKTIPASDVVDCNFGSITQAPFPHEDGLRSGHSPLPPSLLVNFGIPAQRALLEHTKSAFIFIF